MRNFEIGIKSWGESSQEAVELFEKFDSGVFPAQPIERVFFHDVKTFLRDITPKRIDLLEELHRNGGISIRALAKLLNRSYKNVYDDVKLPEQAGLVEKDENGLYSVPWDEVSASFKLAA